MSSSATSDEDESPTDVFPTMAEVEQADSGSLDLDQFVKDSADSHRLDEYHGKTSNSNRIILQLVDTKLIYFPPTCILTLLISSLKGEGIP